MTACSHLRYLLVLLLVAGCDAASIGASDAAVGEPDAPISDEGLDTAPDRGDGGGPIDAGTDADGTSTEGSLDGGGPDGAPIVDAMTDPDAGPGYRLRGAAIYLDDYGDRNGSPYAERCGDGRVAIALGGHTDDRVDYATEGTPAVLELWCATLRPDGTLGEASLDVVAGNSCDMVGRRYDTPCAAGSAVVGMHGTVVGLPGLTILGDVGVSCAPLGEWVDGAAEVMRLPTQGAPRFADGGIPFDALCDPGWVAAALAGYEGCNIGSVSLGCVRVTR